MKLLRIVRMYAKPVDGKGVGVIAPRLPTPERRQCASVGWGTVTVRRFP
jgi:hypothetical protein